MITFTHCGRSGDIIFSLWYVRAYCNKVGQKAIYHLQTNVFIPKPTSIDKTHKDGDNMLTYSSAQFIKPLLQKCQFIEEVLIGDQRPEGAIDLNLFRSEAINLYSGDLREFYYSFGDYALARDFEKPVIDVQPDYKYKDKILFTLSQRYVNPLNYVKLKKFEDKIAFMGTEKEFKHFNENYFKLKERVVITNMLEAAQYMKGSVGYIANQTGLFAVAEALKVKRCLFPVDWMMVDFKVIPGPKNVIPVGGECYSTSKANMIPIILEQMFK